MERPPLRGRGARVNRAFVTLASSGPHDPANNRGEFHKDRTATAGPNIAWFPVPNMNEPLSGPSHLALGRAIGTLYRSPGR
jgi:hypothetical protein